MENKTENILEKLGIFNLAFSGNGTSEGVSKVRFIVDCTIYRRYVGIIATE